MFLLLRLIMLLLLPLLSCLDEGKEMRKSEHARCVSAACVQIQIESEAHKEHGRIRSRHGSNILQEKKGVTQAKRTSRLL